MVIPLGVAPGRRTRGAAACPIGTPVAPMAPVSSVPVVPVTLAPANLTVAGPGWVAGRLRPATVLRAE